MTNLIKWWILFWVTLMLFIIFSNIFLSDFMCNLKIYSMMIMKNTKIFLDVFFPFTISTIRVLIIVLFLKFTIWKLVSNVWDWFKNSSWETV